MARTQEAAVAGFVKHARTGVVGVAVGPNGVVACTVRPTKAQARAELRARVPQGIREDAAATRDACTQITEYLDGSRKRFQLRIDFNGAGTEFQRQVWRELTKVKFGDTVSYGELAERVGRPGAARAIGNAMNQNRHWLIVPCHRVITSSGGMGGYGGGEHVKRALLELEGAIEPLLF